MKKIFVLILIALCLAPLTSFAAEISFSAPKNTFAIQEDFLVQIYLDTKGESVNAVAGTVKFPDSLVDVQEVRDGNSAINFWVEKPHEVQTGKIAFSGITTGGFVGSKIFLFSIVFHSNKLGSGEVSLEDIQTLKNDGSGTNIQTDSSPFAFSISKTSNTQTQADLSIADTNPPEDFTPFITRDPHIFDGKYFIVFSTVDKSSGVDHYEVRESAFLGFGGDYIQADSPYELQGQHLLQTIYVKAVDKNGNERIVKINPQNRLAWLLEFIILVILGVLVFYVYKKIWLKITK